MPKIYESSPDDVFYLINTLLHTSEGRLIT